MTLWVDTDQTLVLYEDGGPQPNWALCRAVRTWAASNPEARVVVWSAEGAPHAAYWGRRLLDDVADDFLEKKPSLIRWVDTVVDDDPDLGFPLAATRFSPEAFTSRFAPLGIERGPS